MTTFCTADEIATAIVAAARLEGEDPAGIARGAHGGRARWVAFAALIDRFPENDYRAIALGCGFLTQSTMENSRSLLAFYRRGKGPKWWDEGRVAIVALDGLDVRAPAHESVAASHAPQERAPQERPSLVGVLPEDAPLGPAAPPPVPVLRDVDALPAPRANCVRRRETARMAELLGDPAPGRSALAQRNGGAVEARSTMQEASDV